MQRGRRREYKGEREKDGEGTKERERWRGCKREIEGEMERIQRRDRERDGEESKERVQRRQREMERGERQEEDRTPDCQRTTTQQTQVLIELSSYFSLSPFHSLCLAVARWRTLFFIYLGHHEKRNGGRKGTDTGRVVHPQKRRKSKWTKRERMERKWREGC